MTARCTGTSDVRGARCAGARAAGLAALLLALAIAPAAHAAPGEAPADPSAAPQWAYAITHELMSPFCPGRSLHDCPSPQADELRLWILTQAAAGASQDEVVETLYARFGEQLRSTPKAEGWGLTAYLLPAAFALLGLPLVYAILRRLARSDAAPPAAAPPRDVAPPRDAAPPGDAAPPPGGGEDEYARRIDAELAS